MATIQLDRGQIIVGILASACLWFGLYAGLGITSLPTDEVGGMWSRLGISAGIALAFLIIGLYPAAIGNAHARAIITVLFAILAVASHLADTQDAPFAGMITLNILRGMGNGFIYAQMGAFLFMLTARQSAFAISIAMCLAGIGAFTVNPLEFATIDTILMYTKIFSLLAFLALPFAREKRSGLSAIIKTAPQAMPLFVELCLLSIVYGLTATAFTQFEQAAALRGIPLINQSIVYLAPAAVLLVAVSCRRKIDFFSIRWVLLPLMAIFLVPLLVDNLIVALVAELVLLALFQVLEASSTISFIEIDREYGLPPISSFATLRVGGTLGILLGRAIAFAIVVPALDAAVKQGASLATPAFEISVAIILIALIVWRNLLKYPSFEYGALTHNDRAANSLEESPTESQQTYSLTENILEANTSKTSQVQPEQKSGNWQRKCDSFTQTYALSSREKEVLQLLARGRNAIFIGKELYISESTVRTHIAHIYQKANVHSQQELIDLVEAQ